MAYAHYLQVSYKQLRGRLPSSQDYKKNSQVCQVSDTVSTLSVAASFKSTSMAMVSHSRFSGRSITALERSDSS